MRPGERDDARDEAFRSEDTRTAPGVHQLIADALREASTLASKEFELFRKEMSHNAKLLVSGIVALVVAAVFAIGTLILLTTALVDWIAIQVGSRVIASLIVAGVTLLLTIIFLLVARSRLSAATLEPRRTIKSIERDSEIVSQRMNG
jgi:cytochrome c biogenesis factor